MTLPVNGFAQSAAFTTPAFTKNPASPRFAGVHYFDDTEAGEAAEDHFVSNTCKNHTGWEDAVKHTDADVAFADPFTGRVYYAHDDALGNHLKILRDAKESLDAGRMSELQYAGIRHMLSYQQPVLSGVFSFDREVFGPLAADMEKYFIEVVCPQKLGSGYNDEKAVLCFNDLTVEGGRNYYAVGNAAKALTEAQGKQATGRITLKEYERITHRLAQQCELKDGVVESLSAEVSAFTTRIQDSIARVFGGAPEPSVHMESLQEQARTIDPETVINNLLDSGFDLEDVSPELRKQIYELFPQTRPKDSANES